MTYSVDDFSMPQPVVYDSLSPLDIAEAKRSDDDALSAHSYLLSQPSAQVWLERGSAFGLLLRSVFGPLGR